MRTAIRTAVAVLSCAASLTFAQDYEREKRWADEVAPGVVVGDAVWIEAGSGRKFLALYTPVIVKYRDEKTDAAASLEEALR